MIEGTLHDLGQDQVAEEQVRQRQQQRCRRRHESESPAEDGEGQQQGDPDDRYRRVWVAKYEAGAFDDDAQAADLIQEYEAAITSSWRPTRVRKLERRP